MESIKQERANPSFPVRQMTYLLDGGQKHTLVRTNVLYPTVIIHEY